MGEPRIKKKKKTRGLQRKNRAYNKRTDMGTMSKRELRKMKRHATGRTAVGKLITKGARALKNIAEQGLTGIYENYARKRRKKLESKISAEPQGMGRRKKRLIKRKNRWT